MKAQTVHQFERGQDPKDAMNIGIVRPKKGDRLLGKDKNFILRNKKDPGNTVLFINRLNGKITEVGLCNMHGAIQIIEQIL